MPTLTWIGKETVVGHHKQIPLHLLVEDPTRGVGGPAAGNLLIEGDNLLALKALLLRYVGQVKCIYIGILHDKTLAGGNVLTRAVLELLPAPPDFAGQRVVYDAACPLSATHLRQANVVFRQIPYELRVG